MKYLKFFIVTFLGAIIPAAHLSAEEPAFDAQQFLKHIRWLSAPELEGRATGSPGQKAAATYVAAQLNKLGLQPLGEHNDYLQKFEAKLPARRKMGSNSALVFYLHGQKIALDYTHQPFGFSPNRNVRGPLVFAGYSITSQELEYDDFKNIDVKDKIVLCFRHSPGEANTQSDFAAQQMRVATFVNKVKCAAEAGAKALILINDFNHVDDPLIALSIADATAKIPFIQIRRDTAVELLRSFHKDLKEIQSKIDWTLRAQSFALPGVEADVNVEVVRENSEYKPTENILALLPGSDKNLAKEVVVIGAHYDHVGLGYFGTSSEDRGLIHPGADDNSSGVAGLLLLAKAFKESQPAVKRSIVFAFFSAEELGLFGSAYYVKHPPIPLADTVVMINLDMIGRAREGFCEVGGANTAPNFASMVKSANSPIKLDLKFSNNIIDDSDHASFYKKDIPILFFFTGFHPDYHRPTDTWEKINVPDALRVLRLTYAVGWQLANGERPEFEK